MVNKVLSITVSLALIVGGLVVMNTPTASADRLCPGQVFNHVNGLQWCSHAGLARGPICAHGFPNDGLGNSPGQIPSICNG